MCSWSWGFNNTWKKVQKSLPDSINIQYVLGGLAPDSNEIMPEKMRAYIQENWRKIQSVIPGTEFNYDFWQLCKPKRSTYPACRAIISVKNQDPTLETQILKLIQQAYYLNAQNPSENSTLIQLAKSLKLDIKKFKKDLNSSNTQQQLEEDIALAKSLNIHSFPSLLLSNNQGNKLIAIDYNNADKIIKQILD